MLSEDHVNKNQGYFIKTEVLPSRPTGTLATRSHVVEEWCKKNDYWIPGANGEGHVAPPLKRSPKGSYTFGKKIMTEPWVQECKAAVDTITSALKLRPSTVWKRNEENLKKTLKAGLQDRLQEASDKQQDSVHVLSSQYSLLEPVFFSR